MDSFSVFHLCHNKRHLVSFSGMISRNGLKGNEILSKLNGQIKWLWTQTPHRPVQ